MNENKEIILPKKTNSIDLPQIKPIRLGEYGRQLEKMWAEFAKIRKNGIYAADDNHIKPSFSEKFIVHGLAGRHSRVDGKITFAPPNSSTVEKITKVGVLSSDVEFIDETRMNFIEEETSGTADFFIGDKPVSSIQELLTYLRRRVSIGNEYITDPFDTDSATIMFAFDSARPELRPLMQYAMVDNQAEETLWPNKLGQKYIDFPMKGSGLHIAIPIGLPANYIEFIIINEQNQNWQGEKLNLLRTVAICDGHPIPLVSAATGRVID